MKRERFHMPSSVFLILQKDQNFCFLHRTQTGWMDGFYSLPAGGVERGETLMQAVIREAREEVGIVLDPAHLHLAHTLQAHTDRDTWLGHFFVAEHWHGEPTPGEPHKHSHLCWSTLQNLSGQLVPYVEVALQNHLRGKPFTEHGFAEAALSAEP